ncbi:MAG: hypothetical protein GC136_05400 [Alphaproteobacteria bacterium]|nr:hypothetical protein [Alphaproteobacteria bacterium]
MAIKQEHQAAAGTNQIVGGIDIEAINMLSDKKSIFEAEKAIDRLLRDNTFTAAEKSYTLKMLAEVMTEKRFVNSSLNELKARSSNIWEHYVDYHGEKYAEEFFYASKRGKFGSLLYESELLGYWTHQVCHLFEKYGQELSTAALPHSFDSLLSAPDFYPAAEILINEMIKRLEALGGNGPVPNSNRIFTPIGLLNIDALAENPHLNTWRFMPAALNNEAVLCRVRDISSAMFSSPTPEEFYNKLVSGDVVYKGGRYSDETVEKLRQFIIARGGESAVPANFLQTGAPEEEIADIVAYDVDGTLLDAQGNLQVHVYIQLLEDSDEAEIYTGGNIEDNIKRLKEAIERAGLHGRWDEMKPKTSLEGLNIKRLVDDTPPQLQGFKAQEWVHPDKLRLPAKSPAPELKQP